MIDLIEFHIVEHCNLNCKGCIHFTPLADKSCIAIKTFKNDVKKIASIFSGDIKEIHILGGEPLLHPELNKILKITRKHFKNSEIKLISNGILILSQKEIFWKTLKQNDIHLSVTEYPIGIDYQKISHLTKKYGIKYSFYAPSKKNAQWHFPIDLLGSQDEQYAFDNCRKGNNCTNINIIDGKLYMCPIASNIKYFNKFFNKDCKIERKDYLKIKEIKNIEEINQFISKPTPFCRYCNIEKRTFDNKWEVTQRKIEEWI